MAKSLQSDEIIAEFGVSKWYILTYFIAGIILSIVIVGVIFIIMGFYYWLNYKYTLTDKKVISRRGVFNIRTDSATYDRITDISLFQHFGERIFFRMGTLEINTAGSERPEIVFYKTENPKAVKQLIFDMIQGNQPGKKCVYCSYALHREHAYCPGCGKKV